MPTLTATKVEYNHQTFYIAVMSGKELLEASIIRRRHEAPKRGFQRGLDGNRARTIAKYYDSGRTTIPSNIILSAQPAANVSYRGTKLTWSGAERSFLVLDGQHRLFAMEYTHEDYPFAVAIYTGLRAQDEVRLFIDINTNQRGVPSALLLDIKQDAGIEKDPEAKLRELFDLVAAHPKSPLKGLMSKAEAKRGHVTRVTFNSAMKPVMAGSVLSNAPSPERQADMLVNYLIAADRTLTAAGAIRNRLTNSTTLHAFLEIFNDVVPLTVERAGELSAGALTETLNPLVDMDFDGYVGSNRPSRAVLVNDMRALVKPALTITDDMF